MTRARIPYGWQRRPRFLAGLLLQLALVPAIVSSAAAGGWTQPEGAYYVKVWDRSLLSPREGIAFGTDGKTVGGLSGFQDHQLNLYAEYGLLDHLTLVGFSTPVGFAAFAGESSVYVGTTGFGARLRLLDSSVKLAVQGQASYAPPVGDDVIAKEQPEAFGPAVVYVPTVETAAGELQLQAGYGMSWGWLTGYGGVRANSASAVGHAVTGFAQLGVSRLEHFQFDGHCNLYQSFDAISMVNLSGAGRTSYLGLGLGAAYAVTERAALVIGLEGVAYARSNAGAASMTVGVEFKRL